MSKEMIVKGTFEMEDMPARKWIQKLDAKLDRVNERTKTHSREIKEIEKRLEEYENKN